MKHQTQRVVTAAQELVNALKNARPAIPAQLLGSTAVAITCPCSIHFWDILNRKEPDDIDILVSPRRLNMLATLLNNMGYGTGSAGRHSNDAIELVSSAVHRRPIYYANDGTFYIEVHLDPPCFHHPFKLNGDLIQPAHILSPTDLFLSKLQYDIKETEDAELRLQMDAQLIDLTVLLHEYELEPDRGTAKICVSKITGQGGTNWEMFTTMMKNLDCLNLVLSTYKLIGSDAITLVRNRIISLKEALNKQPKTLAWKMRSYLQNVLPSLPVGRPIENTVIDRWSNYGKPCDIH